MRTMALAVLALVLTSGLSGCGDRSPRPAATADGESRSTVALDDIDPCGDLTAEIVTRLVGAPVSLRENEDRAIPICDFVADGDEVGSIVQVLALPVGGPGGFTDFEQVIDTQRTGDGEIVVDDVDLDGVDQAALIDDEGYGLIDTVLVAIDESVAYTVYAVGVTREEQVRVATAALTGVLGGDLPAGSTIEPVTADVCSSIPDRALSEALGAPVTSEASAVGDSPVCTWSGEDSSVLVLDVGSTSRIESLAGVASDDADITVTPVDVGADSEAYISESDPGSTGYLAAGHRLYSITVTRADGADETSVLREVVTLLADGER